MRRFGLMKITMSDVITISLNKDALDLGNFFSCARMKLHQAGDFLLFSEGLLTEDIGIGPRKA